MSLEVRLGASLAAVAAMGCAVAAAIVRVDPLALWLRVPAPLGVVLWGTVLWVVFACATRAVRAALSAQVRGLRAVGVAALVLAGWLLPSLLVARLPQAGASTVVLDALELYFAPAALLWAPAVALLCVRGLQAPAEAGPTRGARAFGKGALLLLGAVALYLALRGLGVGSHPRVLATLTLAALALPFLGAGLRVRLAPGPG